MRNRPILGIHALANRLNPPGNDRPVAIAEDRISNGECGHARSGIRRPHRPRIRWKVWAARFLESAAAKPSQSRSYSLRSKGTWPPCARRTQDIAAQVTGPRCVERPVSWLHVLHERRFRVVGIDVRNGRSRCLERLVAPSIRKRQRTRNLCRCKSVKCPTENVALGEDGLHALRPTVSERLLQKPQLRDRGVHTPRLIEPAVQERQPDCEGHNPRSAQAGPRSGRIVTASGPRVAWACADVTTATTSNSTRSASSSRSTHRDPFGSRTPRPGSSGRDPR